MVITSSSAKFSSFTLKSILSECDTVVPFIGDFTKISGGVLSTVKENVFSGGVYGLDSDIEAVKTAYDLGFIRNKDTNIPKDLDDLLVIFSVPVLFFLR